MIEDKFKANPSDDAFRHDVRSFLTANLPPAIRDKVRDGRALLKDELSAWHATLLDKGWIAPNWPKEHGGTGWSATQRWIFEEEYHTSYCPPVHLFNFKMLGPILIRFGTDAQKAFYLPRILSSEDWWCQGYSEPGSGSDLASLQTRAVRAGDHYVVNGGKIWTSFAHWANRIFCLVRTNPDAKPQAGISFLLIDLESPGITVRPIISIDGRHHFNQVFFDDVKVPVENRVGEENDGWTIAKSLLQFERLNASRYGESLGRLKRLKEIAALTRSGSGRLIDEDWFRRKIVDVEVRLMAVQYTALLFLARIEAGEKLGPESSMLKLRGSQALQQTHELLQQAVGIDGLAFGYEGEDQHLASIEPFYASAMGPQRFIGRGYTIAAGSSEVQRNILASAVLGFGQTRDAR
jgi:alkylation response protein AidB-like acyl-CoA dehydrogenase